MRYVVPEKCLRCERGGRIQSTARALDGRVAICWQCGHCSHVWPVQSHERRAEQRTGPGDRRRFTRADRRTRGGR